MKRGPFTEEEDGHLLEFSDLPMAMICHRIGRSPEACKVRLKKLIDTGAAHYFALATLNILHYRAAVSRRNMAGFDAEVLDDAMKDWATKAAQWSHAAWCARQSPSPTQ